MLPHILLLLGLFVFISCDRFDAVDPVINSSSGDVLIINRDNVRPQGIDTIHVNEGEQFPLMITSLLETDSHMYTWESKDKNVMSVITNEEEDAFAFARAVGPEGSTTTLVITDLYNNVTKEVPVEIVKYWADPLYFTKIGSNNGHHYYFSKQKVSWTLARLFCSLFGGTKGHLLTINSKEENDFINEHRNFEDVWLGLTFLYDNDDLSKWITGEEVSDYENWLNSDNPNLPGSRPTDPGMFAQNYVYMGKNGFWTIEHETNFYFILEFDEY